MPRNACLLVLAVCAGCAGVGPGEPGAGTTESFDDTGVDGTPGSSDGTPAGDSTTDATTDALPPDDSSSGGLPDPCGDGVVDPGEECDDANEIDGDGCNADCFASATSEWTQTWNASPRTMDVVAGMSVGASGRTAIVGDAGFGGPNRFTIAYDADGTLAYSMVESRGPEDVVVADDDAVIVTGASTEGRLLVRKLDPTGAVDWEYADPATMAASGLGIALDPSGDLFVGGFSSGAGMLWRYDAAGAPQDAFSFADVRAIHDIALEGRTVLLAGQVGENTNPWVGEATKEGALQWDAQRNTPPATDDTAWSVGVDGAGYVTALFFMPDEMVSAISRYEPGGANVYTEFQPFPGVGLTDLAVDESGDLLLSGLRVDAALAVADAWVARVTPDLEPIWEQVFVNQPNNSEARAIALAPDHRLMISGNVQGPNGDVNVFVTRMTE